MCVVHCERLCLCGDVQLFTINLDTIKFNPLPLHSAILQGDSAMFDIPDATMAVTVSQMVSVKDAKLSIIDREQGVATKELK